MSPGDCLVLEAGSAHWAESIGEEDAEMMVIYDSARRDFQPVEVGGK